MKFAAAQALASCAALVACAGSHGVAPSTSASTAGSSSASVAGSTPGTTTPSAASSSATRTSTGSTPSGSSGATSTTSGSSGSGTGRSSGSTNRIALIDNDGAPGTGASDLSLPVYQGLLNSAGLTYDTVQLAGDGSEASGPQLAPAPAQLQQYDVVVWFTGDNDGKGPALLVSAGQESALTGWLDQGGKTLILFSEYLVDRFLGGAPANWTLPPSDPLLRGYFGIQGGVGNPTYAAPYDDDYTLPMDSMVYYLVRGATTISSGFGSDEWEIAPHRGFQLNVDVVNPENGIDTLATCRSDPAATGDVTAPVAIGNRSAGIAASSTVVYVAPPLECVGADLSGVVSAQDFFDGLLAYAGIPLGPPSGSSSSGGTGGSSSGAPSSSGASSSGSTAGGSTSSGGSASGGTPYYGVLEREGGPMRAAVFQDAAFTHAALGQLQADPTFVSATWTGPVLSQPLYFVDSATSQTLLIVTTESNEIYALSPSTGSVVWSVPEITPAVDAATYMVAPGTIPTLGITGTPVIDPVARVMYLAAATVVASQAHWQIFAVNLDDGSTVAGWPVDVDGLPITLANGQSAVFTSNSQVQRGALALLDGVVYVPYGGTGNDFGTYHGVVMAIPTANPSAATAWGTSAFSGGGIWGPSGVASDGTSVYVATGNSNADGQAFPSVWIDANSEAVLRLAPGTLLTFSGAATDYFTPSDPAQDWYTDDQDDLDLGSSGVVLFDAPASVPSQLAFAIGKTNNAYLLDRANLGGLGTGLSELPGVSTPYQVFGSMAAYTTALGTYVVASSAGNGTCLGATSAFLVGGSPPALAGAWCSPTGGTGSPIVTTSDGAHDYTVWTLGESLTPLDGDTGAALWGNQSIGAYSHWVTPIVAQGAIYVAGNSRAFKASFP